MSRLEELLQTLCPDGVDYKELGDVGKFFGGLTGKSKEDFQNGNRKFISYMNVYKNPSVDLTAQDFVSINPDERQNEVNFGDILFTGSSETPEECGISSVMVQHPDEPIYLNSFTIGFRLHDSSLLIPDFSKHLFRSAELRKQINKTASGVTRFNVSKARMSKVIIPIPPLPVQEEIVRILDTFTTLEMELEAELAARTKQYEHYRNELLSFDSKSKIMEKLIAEYYSDSVKYKKLGDIGTFFGGLTGKTKQDFQNGNKKFISYMNVYKNPAVNINVKDFVRIGDEECQNIVEFGDILFTGSSETPEECGISSVMVERPDEPFYLNSFTIGFRLHDPSLLIPEFSKHLFRSAEMRKQINKTANGVTRFNVSKSKLSNVVVPIPSFEVQEKIVSILDRFEALVNDLKSGLPAEIALRRKQYEHYRDTLLTFPQTN